MIWTLWYGYLEEGFSYREIIFQKGLPVKETPGQVAN